jgi:hypothetical protein
MRSGAGLAAALAAVYAAKTRCAAQFGGGDLYDRQGELGVCTNHEARTCCDRGNTSRITFDLHVARQLEPSAACVRHLTVASCARCDGEVGTGAKLSTGLIALCGTLCAAWYSACSDDFFAPDALTGHIRLCAPSDVVCSRLGETIATPAEFCAFSGYVAVPDGEDAPCFDGTPAAATLPAGKKSVKKPSPKRDASREARMAWWQLPAVLKPWKKWASRQYTWAANFLYRQSQTNAGLLMLAVIGQLFAVVCFRVARLCMGTAPVAPQRIPEVHAKRGRGIDGGGVD